MQKGQHLAVHMRIGKEKAQIATEVGAHIPKIVSVRKKIGMEKAQTAIEEVVDTSDCELVDYSDLLSVGCFDSFQLYQLRVLDNVVVHASDCQLVGYADFLSVEWFDKCQLCQLRVLDDVGAEKDLCAATMYLSSVRKDPARSPPGLRRRWNRRLSLLQEKTRLVAAVDGFLARKRMVLMYIRLIVAFARRYRLLQIHRLGIQRQIRRPGFRRRGQRMTLSPKLAWRST